jgi:CubicO group peptidase (beta-lactamase class C family)
MVRVRLLACALFLPLVLAAVPVAAAAQAAGEDLTGLWKAKRWFGPEARGPILVSKGPGGWSADFMGRITPARLEAGVLTFDLAGGKGSFRAKLTRSGGLDRGQWFQPASPVTSLSATNVSFVPDGPGRWRGAVQPVEDTLTLYLMVETRADGTLGAFLRSPERNIGVFLNVDHIERDGDALKVMGRRPGATTDSVVMSGAFDRDAGGFSVSFPRGAGTYDFRREGDDSDFWPRGKAPGRYVYTPPPARDDGWPVASVEEVGIDRKGIEAFIQRILDEPMTPAAPQVDGILIARHGKLVVEEYFHGETRDRLHDTRSASKSLTATLIGAAIQAGLPVRLDDEVYKVMNGGRFPDGLDDRKRAMKLVNLLTMTSGHYCDDGDPAAPGREDTMTDDSDDPDYYHYTMAVPMDRTPGERAVYCSADPNLAIGVLWKQTGEYPMDLYDRLIGKPMRIDRDSWFLSPSRQPYGGGSARMVPRDFAKLGQLMLDKGVWKGRRILGEDFVKTASSPLYDLNGIKYGYLWWGVDYPYKDRTLHAVFAGGNGGQGVTFIPELDLVIATFGGSYAARVGLEIQQGYPPRYILPAVREAGDPKDAPYAPRDFVVTYGRPK